MAFKQRCGEAGVRPSICSVGRACDNATAKRFFSTLEAEQLSRRQVMVQAETHMTCVSHIESWCNPARLHSRRGHRSSMTYKAERKATLIEL